MRFCQLCRRKGYPGKEICAYDSEYLSKPVHIEPSEGTTIKDYTLLEVIAQGSTGTIYKAQNLRSGEIVAFKILHKNLYLTPNTLYRLKREIKSTLKVTNPHIATIIDSEDWEGRLYIVREWLEGYPVSVELNKGFLPIERALQIAYQICIGLNAAHRMGLIHRDLKPNHIFLAQTPDGNGIVKLIDFGISAPIPELSRSGKEIIGTPNYIAPEQIQGKLISLRSDLYSLGCLLFYLVTGYEPFKGNSVQEIIEKNLKAPPPSIKDYNSQLPVELDQLIQKLLSKQPSSRPLGTSMVQKELEKISPQVKGTFKLREDILEEVKRVEKEFGGETIFQVATPTPKRTPSIPKYEEPSRDISTAKTMFGMPAIHPTHVESTPQKSIQPIPEEIAETQPIEGLTQKEPPITIPEPSKIQFKTEDKFIQTPPSSEPKSTPKKEIKKTILGMPSFKPPLTPEGYKEEVIPQKPQIEIQELSSQNLPQQEPIFTEEETTPKEPLDISLDERFIPVEEKQLQSKTPEETITSKPSSPIKQQVPTQKQTQSPPQAISPSSKEVIATSPKLSQLKQKEKGCLIAIIIVTVLIFIMIISIVLGIILLKSTPEDIVNKPQYNVAKTIDKNEPLLIIYNRL